MCARILVAGTGNVFLGDDGFGVAVAQRMLAQQRERYSGCVQIIDFGVRGMDLASTLLDDYHTVVLVDAFPRGGQPGSLYLMDSTAVGATGALEVDCGGLDLHRMDPVKVLAFSKALGARPIQTLVVGCEPAFPAHGQARPPVRIGLSPPVRSSVDRAVEIVDALCRQFITERRLERGFLPHTTVDRLRLM